ncbi:MAG: hypothetical protein K0R54_3769 [Clostridiaceae bacterium]|jgi:hypothetical protein|nr:hypothetical protein [Clostridiaceae bacterium]
MEIKCIIKTMSLMLMITTISLFLIKELVRICMSKNR